MAIDLDSIRAALALAAKATPIRWAWSPVRLVIDTTKHDLRGEVCDGYSIGPVQDDDDETDASSWPTDAAAIVALRNAAGSIAALVEEVDALRAKLAEAKRLGLEACEFAADAADVITQSGIDDDDESRDAWRAAGRMRTALEAL